MQLKLIVNIR